MDEVWTDYDEVVNIFYSENNVYVVGNGNFEDAEVQKCVNDYIDNHKEYDVINLIYARETETVNVTPLSENEGFDDYDDFWVDT
jgi:hypothetical protein